MYSVRRFSYLWAYKHDMIRGFVTLIKGIVTRFVTFACVLGHLNALFFPYCGLLNDI